MDKKTMCENLAREAHEKGGFTGAWLYAEGGVIISEGAVGEGHPKTHPQPLPVREGSSMSIRFTLVLRVTTPLPHREGLGVGLLGLLVL